jgi:hypothetical protein
MPAEISAAAHFRRRSPALPGSWKCALAFCFGALIGKNCAAIPSGPDPSDPAALVPPVIYRSVISPYVSLRPSQPAALVQPQKAEPMSGHSHKEAP